MSPFTLKLAYISRLSNSCYPRVSCYRLTWPVIKETKQSIKGYLKKQPMWNEWLLIWLICLLMRRSTSHLPMKRILAERRISPYVNNCRTKHTTVKSTVDLGMWIVVGEKLTVVKKLLPGTVRSDITRAAPSIPIVAWRFGQDRIWKALLSAAIQLEAGGYHICYSWKSSI